MAKLSGLSQYFDPGLTLGGVPGRDGSEREYVVPLPDAELGLWCQLLAEAGGRIHAASTEEEMQAAIGRIEALPELKGDDLTLAQRTLGAAYQAMMADGVSHPHIQYCGATAYAWIVGGEEAAERYWKSGGRPEAWGPVPNRADRRAGRTSTGAAGGTRTPASTSGTTSPSRSSGRGRARGSRGRRS